MPPNRPSQDVFRRTARRFDKVIMPPAAACGRPAARDHDNVPNSDDRDCNAGDRRRELVDLFRLLGREVI
jgi:hypothetical protein